MPEVMKGPGRGPPTGAEGPAPGADIGRQRYVVGACHAAPRRGGIGALVAILDWLSAPCPRGWRRWRAARLGLCPGPYSREIWEIGGKAAIAGPPGHWQ
jgi:hypothetical protein